MRFSRCVPALCLCAVLLVLPGLAHGAEAAEKSTRLRPSGLEGAVLAVNSARPNEDAWRQFVKLAGGDKAKVAIVLIGTADAPLADERLGAVEVQSIELATPEAARDAATHEKLHEATGVWLHSTGEFAAAKEILTDSPLIKRLAEFRRQGRIVAASGSAVQLLDNHQGFAILPGFALATSETDDAESDRDASRALIHAQLAPGAQLLVRGRQVVNLSDEGVSLRLAASGNRPERKQELSRRDDLDYNEWRRAAHERANGSTYPPAQVPKPEVPHGALVIVGGGGMPAEIAQKFVELGGGAEGTFIVLPTSMPDPLPPNSGGEFLKRYGAKHVHVITAREQEDLETPENLALLDQATAVWFGGGRQWRFLDAYQGTQLEAKFHAVLKRGGVIGGSSAGATIQGDYLVRGAPAGPHIMMCEGYERGLGFLPGVGIDQHFAQRKRFADMTSFMQTYPQFLGIGIDEATALIVQGSEAKVLGRGQAHFYNYKSPAVKDAADYESVAAGGAYDLASRQILAYGAQEEFAGTKLDWKPLFNGKDLSGWVNVNCAPETFTAKDDMIVTTGVPTGVMRTERQYENFILELDWRHLKPGGNAGLFVWSEAITSRGVPFARAIEVQVLDGRNTESYTSHGDIFSIHGSTMKPDRTHPGGAMRCLPSERRCKPSPEWNHYRVICNNGTIKLEVNGKEVSGGSDCNYLKGYICLESEGSECHFRNLRIAELPSTKAPAERTAPEETGFVPLYTGLDLRGWKADSGHANHWKPADWVLKYDGQSEAEDKNLWTEKEYKDFVLICDWRLTGEKKKVLRPVILPSGEIAKDDEGKEKQIEVDDAGDSGIYLRGSSKSQVNIWCWPVGSGEVYGYRTDPNQSAEVLAGVTPKTKADRPPGQWNRFIITMRGDRLTVVLNGETVIENAHLPNVPDKGRLALQHHGDAVEFANLLIKELE